MSLPSSEDEFDGYINSISAWANKYPPTVQNRDFHAILRHLQMLYQLEKRRSIQIKDIKERLERIEKGSRNDLDEGFDDTSGYDY